MKFKSLILFVIFSSILVSCEKDMKWINPDDSKADQAEIGKICEEKSAECGQIEYELGGKMRKVFCGECRQEGYECNNNKCQDIDECVNPSLNNCNNEVSICVNEEGTYSCICKENYSGDDCVPDPRTKKCENLPENAEWNTVAKITQTWNGSEWTPSAKGSYNEESSKTECRFKCLENYNWNGVNCEPATRTAKCSELPAGTEWNTASEITQTWSGSEWLPSTASTFNEQASETECRYKCASDFHRENSACISNTKTDVECTGLPAEHASWNIVSTITQTWTSENGWQPSATGVYNETARTDECRFRCDSTYYWDGSECINPCDPNPCNSVSNSNKVCAASDWNKYTCGCVSGYHWRGTETGCTDKISLGNICTSQNKCYNNYEEITCPASGEDFFGQDAQYAVSGSCIPQSFIVIETEIENENIIQDRNTLLQWQQVATSETFTWDKAVTHCEDLDYGGYSDWRLPATNEFLTIVDNSKYKPAIDKTYFVNMPDDSYFWTSKTYNSDNAFYLSLFKGHSFNISKSSTYRAMCVRGNELPISSFTILTAVNGDITVTDSTTGLIWQKTYVSKTWPEALAYCENLDYAGYTDWRLPDKNELASLLNHNKLVLPRSDFPDMPEHSEFWSSSSSSTSYAFLVEFDDCGVVERSKVGIHNVRCIRSDICENGKFWNGSQCINNPCQANSCNHTHETGNCQPRTASTFECVCEEGYFWNGSACVSPCNTNSCGTHSDDNCTPLSLDVYYCGCVDSYSWNAGECKEYSTGLTIGNICTGQDKCYNNSSQIITCPVLGEDFFGQDAQYTDSCTPQSFTIVDTGFENEKIVQDNNTGLQWQQTLSTNSFWENAYIYCDKLTYGGYSDWRLPNPLEILTISDSSRYKPAIDKTYFVNMPDDSYFWTSKTYNSSKVFVFSSSTGLLIEHSKAPTYSTMCVRGSELPISSFVTSTAGNGDITVTDSITGLMWQQEYVANKTWQQALKYCEVLTYAGYDDWRLPNKNELASLLNHNKLVSPRSDFPNMPSDWFWSSSTCNYSAWAVGFYNGSVNSLFRDYITSVLCVRN